MSSVAPDIPVNGNWYKAAGSVMIVTDAPEPIDPRSCATKPRRRAQLIEQSSNSLKSIYRDPLRERLPDKDLFICERSSLRSFRKRGYSGSFILKLLCLLQFRIFVADVRSLYVLANICYIKIIIGFDNTTFARIDFCIDKKDNDRKYRIYKVWFVRKIDSDWETKQTRNIRRSSWAQMNGMKHINRRVFIT